ncbi:MAG: CRISPR-associated endoribonuclease Cas6 [Runella zeae]
MPFNLWHIKTENAMRYQLVLNANKEPVPYNHLHQLTGTIHKWLGANAIHDGLSLYSYGWLKGGNTQKGILHFTQGATWNISFFDDTLSKQLLKGILEDPSVAFGMKVQEVREITPPSFKTQHTFYTDGSSILVRRKRVDGSREYLFSDSLAANAIMTQTLRKKLAQAGFTEKDLQVQIAFDRTYQNPRIRKVTIKGIEHKGSECPIIIEGTPEAIEFAWLVGIGDLTGSGFGALR